MGRIIMHFFSFYSRNRIIMHCLVLGAVRIRALTITVKSLVAAIYTSNASLLISIVFYMAMPVWLVYSLKRKNLSELIPPSLITGVATFYKFRVKSSPTERILPLILLSASVLFVYIAHSPYNFLLSNVFRKAAAAVYDYYSEDGFSVVRYGTRLKINSVRQLIRTVCSAPASVSWEIKKYLIGTSVNGNRKIVSWKLGDELGRGSYGTAYKATDQFASDFDPERSI